MSLHFSEFFAMLITMMIQPTVITFLSDIETPIALFHKLSQAEPTAFLLESSDGDSRLARYSSIGISPAKTVQFIQGQAHLTDHLTGQIAVESAPNPLAVLQAHQSFDQSQLSPHPALPESAFCGGWVGYMGYGVTQFFEGIPQQSADPMAVPDGYYGLYDTVILFDHLSRQISFVSYRDADSAQTLWHQVQSRLTTTGALMPLYHTAVWENTDIFEGVSGPFTRERYIDTVKHAKTLIEEGQIFQIVLAHRFSLPITCTPMAIYRTLQAINPSPYAYYLKFPGFVYLGSSPETFVRCHQGKVVLRALAGTRPRGDTEAEDLRLADELRANEKELAEHHMLVDLGRNDLGRVCQTGTIRVGEIATLTRYTHVMHLATEITGQLRPALTAYDVFKACFPRGTVSGAPKIRAMQLLAQLEPERRGIYSGVVGYFDFKGNMDGAIAIRSALIKDNQAHVHAGAGIVYDSDPDAEYEETRNKAKSMLKAIQLAERSGTVVDSAN